MKMRMKESVSEKEREEQREALYCQRRGFTRAHPRDDNPLQIEECRVSKCKCHNLIREWDDHMRIFRHTPSGTLVVTWQPYIHGSWEHYAKLSRQLVAFAAHHGLRHRLSLVESWYLPNHTALIELWREKRALL
jgi:hypothetical protein